MLDLRESIRAVTEFQSECNGPTTGFLKNSIDVDEVEDETDVFTRMQKSGGTLHQVL